MVQHALYTDRYTDTQIHRYIHRQKDRQSDLGAPFQNLELASLALIMLSHNSQSDFTTTNKWARIPKQLLEISRHAALIGRPDLPR